MLYTTKIFYIWDGLRLCLVPEKKLKVWGMLEVWNKKLEVYVCRKILNVMWCDRKLGVGGSLGWIKQGFVCHWLLFFCLDKRHALYSFRPFLCEKKCQEQTVGVGRMENNPTAQYRFVIKGCLQPSSPRSSTCVWAKQRTYFFFLKRKT